MLVMERVSLAVVLEYLPEQKKRRARREGEQVPST